MRGRKLWKNPQPSDMDSFHWDRHFETGLAEVDRQHHQLVDLINRFGDLLTRIAKVPLVELQSVLEDAAAKAAKKPKGKK